MTRIHSFIGFALVALTSVCATGCMADADEPEQLIWYDEELDACFTEGAKGKKVQVPCEESSAAPGMEGLYNNGTACTGTACCEAINDSGFCR